jgi:thioredoxin-related protein
MKSFFILFIAILIPVCITAQEKQILYNPSLDGITQLKEAITKAKAEKKHVLVQLGGNWCPWCIRFHKFCSETASVDSVLKADYIVIHLNYSPENKNMKSLERLGHPERFGFPVFVILDANGNRLHTQDSGLLEKEKSYDKEKVLTFLKNWNSSAVNPDTYKPIQDSDVNDRSE